MKVSILHGQLVVWSSDLNKMVVLGTALKHPDVRQTLISVNECLANDSGIMAKMVFSATEAVIQTIDGKAVIRGTLSNQLWKTQLLFGNPSNTVIDVFASNVADATFRIHCRTGHQGLSATTSLVKSGAVRGLEQLSLAELAKLKCKDCMTSKSRMVSSLAKVPSHLLATQPLERVHGDLIGPIAISSLSGFVFALLLIDEYSSFVWIFPLKQKSDAKLRIIE